MRISVIGAGYVGLTTAVGFASLKHDVVCIDSDLAKITMINKSQPPFFDKGLESRLANCIDIQKRLKLATDYNNIRNSEIIFICVGTPSRPDGSIDLDHIRSCGRSLGEFLATETGSPVIVLRSTVTPGTTEEELLPILEKTSGKEAGKHFSLAFNPEFLQEGNALKNFENPDKVIIGEYDAGAGNILQDIYLTFGKPIIRTNIKTAELIKYASNAFLATKISFINEIGNICKIHGVDAYEVADAIGQDPRIGRSFLNAGIGFGGSCLPKDLSALINSAERAGYTPHLLHSVMTVNDQQPSRLLKIVDERLDGLAGKTIGILGVAFKPDTDDTRNAKSLDIIRELCGKGALLRVYDPLVKLETPIPNRVVTCKSAEDVIADSDCILILTEWGEFKDINLYKDRVVVDGRRVLDPVKARRICRSYEGICW